MSARTGAAAAVALLLAGAAGAETVWITAEATPVRAGATADAAPLLWMSRCDRIDHALREGSWYRVPLLGFYEARGWVDAGHTAPAPPSGC